MAKGVFLDLTNMKFGRFTVIKRVYVEGKKGTFWKCKCDCGNERNVDGAELKRKNRRSTKSCGCLRDEILYESNKKYNKYDISGEYGVGHIEGKDDVFYFDLEDYDKIKPHYWNINDDGYIYTTINDDINTKYVRMHRYLLETSNDKLTDHINRIRFDNRKENLREVTPKQNVMNITRRKDNKSGTTGVHYHNRDKLWIASISVGGKVKELIRTTSEDLAIKCRLDAELKHYGEYSPNYK